MNLLKGEHELNSCDRNASTVALCSKYIFLNCKQNEVYDKVKSFLFYYLLFIKAVYIHTYIYICVCVIYIYIYHVPRRRGPVSRLHFYPFPFPCKAIVCWLANMEKWKTWAVYRRFLCGYVLWPDHSCFYSCLDLIVLGSTLWIYFCPGQERGAPSLAVLPKRDLRKRRDMYRR